MRFLRQTVWRGEVTPPCDKDYGDAIEIDRTENGLEFIWTIQNGRPVSGLLLNDVCRVRISLVD